MPQEKAESKPIDGYEVYQTDTMVAVGVGKGFGSVVAARHFGNMGAATRAYNRLDNRQAVRDFSIKYPTG